MLSRKKYDSYKYDMYINGQAVEDSRWATEEEMKEVLTEVKIDSKNYDHGGVPLLSDGEVAYIDDSDAHTLIFGATGSKKSRALCMPMLKILAKAGESFVATDPKGELYEHTSGLLKEQGYKVVVLNFRDPSYGDAWNPLTIPYQFYKAGEKDKAAEVLNDFVNSITPRSSAEPFWDKTAGDFCFGLLLVLLECATEEEVNVRSLAYLRTYAGEDNADIALPDLYNLLNKQSLAAISLSGTLTSTNNTRTSILSVVDRTIRIFSAQQNLSEMLSHSSFDISNIGLEKTAVFLIIPDEKDTYHFLASIFIKQCYESLIRVAQEQPNRILPIRTNFVLDEFSNMPTIPDMPSMITAARSRNIRFSLIVQSENQLRKMYNDEAQTIKGNCSNWVFLTSRELPLLKELSELCGYRKSSMIRNEDSVPLISVSQLQRLNKERGEALVFYGRKYPYITQLADITEYKFKHLASQPLVKRKKKLVPVFQLNKYIALHSEEELTRLFADECNEVPEDVLLLTP